MWDIQMSSGSAIKTTGQGAVTLELNGTNIAKSNTGGAGIQKMIQIGSLFRIIARLTAA